MRLARLAAAAGAGGALGAAIRAWATQLGAPGADPAGVLTVTLVINVVGSAALAALPAAGFVRRSATWSVFLGTGVLGGFTTMSTAVALPVAESSPASTAAYLALTLGAALLAVWTVRRFVLAPGSGGLEPEAVE